MHVIHLERISAKITQFIFTISVRNNCANIFVNFTEPNSSKFVCAITYFCQLLTQLLTEYTNLANKQIVVINWVNHIQSHQVPNIFPPKKLYTIRLSPGQNVCNKKYDFKNIYRSPQQAAPVSSREQILFTFYNSFY